MKTLKSFLFLLVMISCDNLESENVPAISFDNYTIVSGQSFGFCIGKCHQEIIIKGSDVTFLVKERTWDKEGKMLEKVEKYNEKLPTNVTNNIRSTFNEKAFFELKEVYGCPDCADGGAEFIEIITDRGKKHKVTFEFGDKVAGFEELIVLLRSERNRLSDKYIKDN